jgi:alkylation response protein AidB-like acyl-CoA dehydrogenase
MYEVLLDDKGLALRDEARRFMAEVPHDLVKRMDADQVTYPREFVEEAGHRNLLGLRFPPSLGGRGAPWTHETAAVEEAGVLGSALACAFVMPSIVGEALWRFGTPDQKQRFLVPMLRGEKVAAEALTEPRGGSDFFGATTRAVPDAEGFLVTGSKRFIVGAEGADFFLTYVKTDPDARPHQSISVLLIERGDGVRVEHVYGLMGTRGGGTGRVTFKDVHVPRANLVGGLNEGGEIFGRMMMPERMTSAAGAVGTGRAALEVAARYTTRRKAFGRTIRDYQAVSFKLADAISRLDAARALAYAAARTLDEDRPARRIVSEAKKVCTEAAWSAVNDAMQVMGGIGYTSVYPIERLLRDARLMMIWTGTNEVMDLLIQHEYYRELEEAPPGSRDIERDAADDRSEEKIFE